MDNVQKAARKAPPVRNKTVVSRRSFVASTVCLLGAPFVNRGRFRAFAGTTAAGSIPASTDAEYSAETIELVRESTVIDMLGLLTLDYKKLASWRNKPSGFQPAEIQQLKDSGITVFHPAVGYTGGNIYEESLKDITGWNIFIAGHADSFLRVDSPADLATAKQLGKIGIIIGQQNSEHFRTVGDVDRFYAMGQRVSQLTYEPNRIGGGSTDPHDSGLTDYGIQIVERMNTLGMAVDISHCADKTTLDAIEASRKPVLITHSNCRALMKSSARCKSDTAIQKMAAKGGVMGITMVRFFVGAAGMVTMENVLDHIDHVVNLAGVEHVGVGTDVDLDGRDRGNAAPGAAPARKNDLDGVEYEKKIFDLTEGLLRRNYTRENVKLILGGNFERALNQIWTPAA
jgi:membrane dipeptidase